MELDSTKKTDDVIKAKPTDAPMRAFGDLLGKTIVFIEQRSDDLIVLQVTGDHRLYGMWHTQDCCERVYVESVSGGELRDLIGRVITLAEESEVDLSGQGEYDESATATFYRIGTMYQTLVIRWIGESNGYYSESVDFGVYAD